VKVLALHFISST